jgi:hypothetical protein
MRLDAEGPERLCRSATASFVLMRVERRELRVQDAAAKLRHLAPLHRGAWDHLRKKPWLPPTAPPSATKDNANNTR